MTKQEQFNQACIDGDIKTVKLLINEPDVDPSYANNDPIRLAAYHGHKEVVEFLMQDSRVDPSDLTNGPIFLASVDGHKEVVELLMQDPRVDPSDLANGAVRWAARNGHKEVVELLLTDKRVMDKIDDALKWYKYKEKGGYELLKVCVDEHKRQLKQNERELETRELIAQMEKDAEMWF